MKRIKDVPDTVRDKATVAALNKTIAKGKTEMTRQISAEFNVMQKDVRPQLEIKKASLKSGIIEATLQAFGRRRGHRSRNVAMFDAREVKGNGPARKVKVRFPNGQWRTITIRDGGGVSIKIKRNGPRKLIPHAFLGNQGRTVFIRTGNDRLPIKAVETIDIPQMFNTQRVFKRVVDRVRTEFPIEMQRAIRYLSLR